MTQPCKPTPKAWACPTAAAFTAATAALALAAGLATTQPAAAQDSASRGQLLYENHCGACHTQSMHWRDQRVASDWGRLVALVGQWQARENLGWAPEDITEVARYLNDSIYKHPRPDAAGRVKG